MTAAASQVKQTAGNLPGAGPGRPKGSQNKVTATLKDAVIKAAEISGEDANGKNGLVGYCTRLANEEPKAFAALLGRILPLQVSGEDGAALTVQIVRYGDDTAS